jgi:hypothetical protein
MCRFSERQYTEYSYSLHRSSSCILSKKIAQTSHSMFLLQKTEIGDYSGNYQRLEWLDYLTASVEVSLSLTWASPCLITNSLLLTMNP